MNKLAIFSALALGVAVASCNAPGEEASGPQKITILQTADIHGQVYPHSELFWDNEEISFKTLGGLANMKTLFDQEREANPNTIVLDGGDLIQGSAVAALSKGEAFMNIVKAMNFDFLIPGNWEVVYGKDQMMKVLKGYDTPVITANMYNDDKKDPIFPQYWIKEMAGVKLGFISYNDPEVPIRQNPSFSKGLDFHPVLDNLEALVNQLKDKEGCDILFVVTHLGISKQYDLANNPAFERVDYLLGNDTHERIREPLQAGHSRVTEPGAFASFVGKMVLTVENGKIINEEYELMEVDPTVYPADEAVAAVIEEAVAPYKDEMDRVLGYSRTPLYRYFVVENPMDNFITDAAMWKNNVDIALSNGFRFSPPIVPGENGVTPITKGDIWNMIPVNEKVKIGKASGQQIKDWQKTLLKDLEVG
jgi:5'-nucleotidase